MTARMCLGWVLGLTLMCHASLALAQTAQALQLVSPEEARALRRTLSAPVPEGANAEQLREHFVAKDAAARRLADSDSRMAVAQQAMEKLPHDGRWPSNLGVLLQAQGRWDESRRMYETAKERTPSALAKLYFESNLVNLLALRQSPEAENRLTQARMASLAALADKRLTPLERILMLRTLSSLAASEYALNLRRGRLAETLAAATEGEQRARAALEAALGLPTNQGRALDEQLATATDLAVAQKRLANVLRLLERDAEAQAVLEEHMRTIVRQPVHADFAAGAHHALALLRLAQRAFVEAEQQLRLSLQVLDRMGTPADATVRQERIADLVLALWAQGRAADARSTLDSFEQALAGSRNLSKLSQLALARGLVALGSDQPDRAAQAWAELVQAQQREYGAGHYLVAQAQGLQGAALWRSTEASKREQGTELLRSAVPDLLSPRNADQDTERGVRRMLRELILSAYVDAMTRRGGLSALWAMGVADGQRGQPGQGGGVTAQALADTALRAAANDPALSALVRQEQDARREMQAAEPLLQEVSPAEALPPEAAARLRARVSELSLLRQQVQQRLRERFPGYEQLVHPSLPDPAAVAQRLGRGEALVLLLPTTDALLAWTISADELPQFTRLDVSAATLKALVQRLRKGFDFAANGGRAPPFDSAAAQELYRRVLAPLEPRFRAAQQLIVSASGPLASAPLATLLTEPQGSGPPAWLVRRWAITQVPSVAAWLSLRQLPRSRPAPEALLAWGDPSFSSPLPARAMVRDAAAAARYSDLPALPETRDEILAIAKAVKADLERDLRVGSAATRDSVIEASRSGELAKKRIVVFATHGLVAGDLPGLKEPALAMAAPFKGADFSAGLLTLEDVLGLKLNADWVVLSACNTAASDGRSEDLLSGLARGFFYAGTRSVLVTQWAVETESAKLLTTRTFEHQARDPKASKAESLRQAMLSLMAQPAYAHPAFWAPYMLVGDGAR